MKAKIKTDFEKHLIAQLTKEGSKYYKTINSLKTYFWFEGQTITPSDNFVNLTIIPSQTERIATGAKYHTGVYRFYCYSTNALNGDKIIDGLSAIIDELTVEQTGGFRIELDVLSTFQRGNKFENSTHYETIADIEFRHWEC
jgi:hypothetical protein